MNLNEYEGSIRSDNPGEVSMTNTIQYADYVTAAGHHPGPDLLAEVDDITEWQIDQTLGAKKNQFEIKKEVRKSWIVPREEGGPKYVDWPENKKYLRPLAVTIFIWRATPCNPSC